MTSFYERNCPRSLTDVCGHSKTMRKILTINKTMGLAGQAFWFVGESGTGKTTIARIIANLVADPVMITEIDAQDVTMDLLRSWQDSAHMKPIFGDSYAYIINEAHGLSAKTVSRLQTILEDPHVQKNTTWLFTTTNKGQRSLFDSKMDASPFLSRCIPLPLELDEETVMAMSKRLKSIADAEELDGGFAVADYQQLLIDCQFNMRQALQRIASGDMLKAAV